MIDNKKIEALLKSFYDGNSTKEEEQILKEYFLTNINIPSYLEVDRQLFVGLKEIDNVVIPDGFEDRLDAFIDTFECKNEVVRNNKVKFINWRWVSSIAASIIIVVSISVAYFNAEENIRVEPKDTFTDVNQAYSEAEKALLLISENLNKGEVQFAKAQAKVDDVNAILSKNFNK